MKALGGIGVASLLVYGVIAYLIQSSAGQEVPEQPILPVLAGFCLAFLLYLLALGQLKRHLKERSESVSSTSTASRRLGTILGFAFLFRLLFLFTTPFLEVDIYRYLWDGNVVATGTSPYLFSPAEVQEAQIIQPTQGLDIAAHPPTTALNSDDTREQALQRLARLRDSDLSLSVILSEVHYAALTSVYPPVSQAVFACAAWLTPDHASVSVHITVLKLFFLLFECIAIVCLIGLLRLAGRSGSWCLAYAWCPLPLKEFANSGHADSIAICAVLVALWILLARRSIASRILGGICIGLAIGVKLYAIVLLPVLILMHWRKNSPDGKLAKSSASWAQKSLPAIALGMGSLLTILVVFWPMRQVILPHHASELGVIANSSETRAEGTPAPGGLPTFLSAWKINDFLFLIVSENLSPSSPEAPKAWFVQTPQSIRQLVVDAMHTHFGVAKHFAPFLLTRILFLGLFALLSLYFALRLLRREQAASVDGILQACFLTLAWFWLLLPTQNPWYWLWALPLIPFAKNPAWYGLSGLLFLSYLRFHFESHWENRSLLGLQGDWIFHYLVVWVEYLPFWIALVTIAIWRRFRSA